MKPALAEPLRPMGLAEAAARAAAEGLEAEGFAFEGDALCAFGGAALEFSRLRGFPLPV